MDFVKLRTGFYREAQIAPLSPAAVALYVTFLCLCGELETDGELCEAQLRGLPGARALPELLKAKLVTRRGKQFVLPWTQVSKKELDEKREQWRAAGKASAAARAKGPNR